VEKKRVALTDGQSGKVELPYKRVLVYIIMAATALYVAELFSVYAAQLPSAIYYPLSKGLAVLATFLLDVIVFKDKVTVKKIIGLCLVIIAIVLVNL
jgi:multidrug transporter EmrE-like cation transporter